MKPLLTLLVSTAAALGAAGDLYYQKLKSPGPGYEPLYLTPVNGRVLQWDGSGELANLALGSLATLSAAPAGTLTGTTLASGVVTSSLTSVGTIGTGTWQGAAVGVLYGGTGRATGSTAYGLIAAGTTATGTQQTLAAGATTTVLVGGGASALPVWTTATGSGSPVRGTSPTISSPVITNIAPAANFTLTQNSVAAITSVNSGAVANSLYVTAGSVGFGTTTPGTPVQVINTRTIYSTNNVGIFSIGTPPKSGYPYTSRMFFSIDNETNSSHGQGYIQVRNINDGVNSNLLLNPNGGGVAIGCSLADQALAVGQNGNAFLKMSNTSGYGYGVSATPYAGIVFQTATADNSNYQKGGVVYKDTDTAGYCRGQLRFLLNPTADNSNVSATVDTSTVMMLDWDNGGRMGVGTLTPTEKLAVAGNDVVSGYRAGAEMTAPSAPAADGYRIYAEDNGSGKTRLMVKFATGAAQQIAIEP